MKYHKHIQYENELYFIDYKCIEKLSKFILSLSKKNKKQCFNVLKCNIYELSSTYYLCETEAYIMEY